MRTYDHTKHRGRLFEQGSMTVPDQSYTVRDLLRRFRNGTMPPVSHPGEFDDGDLEDPLPDFSAMDLTEIAEYQQKLNNRIIQLKQEYERSKQNYSGSDRHPASNPAVPQEGQPAGDPVGKGD